MLDAEAEELRLVAWRGFHAASAVFWTRVSAGHRSTCGIALGSGERVLVEDVETEPAMAGSRDLREYRRSRIRAVQSTPLVTRDGRVIGMMSTHWRLPHHAGDAELRLLDVLARQAADVLDREQARAELDASRALLHDALATARMASWVWDTEHDRIDGSPSLADVFGLPADGTISSSEAELALVHGDDRVRHRAVAARALARGGSWDLQVRIVRPRDGRVAWLEERATSSRDPVSGKTRVTGLVWDITETKEAESALAESERRLQAALDAGRMGTFLWYPDDERADADDRMLALCGLPPDDGITLQSTLETLLHPDDHAWFMGAIARASRGGSLREDVRFRRPDGSEWVARVSARGERAAGGQRRIAGTIVDVTEEAGREQLERDFISNAAHELRTPLAAIIAAVAALEAGAKDDPVERDRFYGHLKREAERLTRLVNSLLLLAQTEALQEIPCALVAVKPLLDVVAASLHPHPAASVVVDAADDLVFVTNEGLVERLLTTIGENAAEHTDEGTITLHAAATADGLLLEVRDTGDGIDTATLTRAFDRFYRDRRRPGGFGLGLSIAKQCARAFGAEIDLTSDPGGGTVAYVLLPKDPAA